MKNIEMLYFNFQVLSDETKRKEYDMYGATSEQMNMRGGPRRGTAEDFAHAWNFKSSVDPEELFRKIFGDAGFGNHRHQFDDFAESQFGYGSAQEVRFIFSPD